MLKKLGLLLLVSPFVFAEPLIQWEVTPVTQQDGDTIGTSQVSVGVCPGTSCPTTLSAPATYTMGLTTTNYGQRKRTFVNTSSFQMYIGTNTTTLTTTGFLLTPSTGTAPSYTTYNNATFYATGVATGTVAVITETNSIP